MTANKYFENVAKLRHKRMTVKYHHHIQKEMDSESDSYHPVRNLLPSLFAPKNVKSKHADP
jgi:hypothetical protein